MNAPFKPFERSPETDQNFAQKTFFHGAECPADVAAIRREGFRSEYLDEDGRWYRDGNLGVGIYLSCNWKTALWFGQSLLRVTVLSGTKIFDTSVEPDRAVLDGLVRRFGKEILTSTDFQKAKPENKSLRFGEFAELFRYRYREAWLVTRGMPREWPRWTPRLAAHHEALKPCIRHLRHCGFHGFGHPVDDNGVLVFRPERLRLDSVLTDVPPGIHWKLTEKLQLEQLTFEELIRKYSPR